MGKKYFGFIVFVLSAIYGTAQLNVTSNNNAAQLAQIIAGPGVTVSNAVTHCNTGADGSFSCTACNLGIDSGIVLTTGLAANAKGPNNNEWTDKEWGTAGDSDIANLIGIHFDSLWDACSLEFDLQVLSDSIQFNYVFGSEEYPAYICSSFNDAFGFFISGPGIAGKQNMALIPGTVVPVAINSVNSGIPGINALGGTCNKTNQSLSYSQYYVNNGDGNTAPYNSSAYYIQYNGFTKVLTASYGGLQPCQTYHLKLAISDIVDSLLDSGVFIQANSLTSNGVSLDSASTTDPNIKSAVRGCVNGVFTLKFVTPVGHTTSVHYQIAGTAVNGTDYNTITDSVVFQPGDSAKQIIIQPKTSSSSDSVTVKLYLFNLCNSLVPYDSAILYIVDSIPLSVTPHTTTLCPGDSAHLLATGGANYTWTPIAGLSSTIVPNPSAAPATTTTYKCTSTIGACVNSDTARVTVLTVAPFTVDAGLNDTSCNGTGVQINAIVTGTPVNGNAFVYTWAPAAGLSNPNIINPVATPATPTEYVLQVASGNCKVKDSLHVIYGNISANTAKTNTQCPTSADGSATINVTGSNPYTYKWSNNQTTKTASLLAAATYTVTATDNAGCTVSASVVVSNPPAIHFNTPAITNVACFGKSTGSITETATGGNGTFGYAWSNAGNTSTINNLPVATYTVTATDVKSCSADTSISITQPAQLQLADTVTNITCFGKTNGALNIGVTGGVGPYSYAWSNGPVTRNIANLAVNTYSVTVTDFNTCTITVSAVITQPQQLQIADTVSNTLCFGNSNGAVNIGVTGGVKPFNFAWSNGAFSQNIANLAVNNYTLTVTDSNSCTASLTATVSQQQALQITDTVSNITCDGLINGAVHIGVSNGKLPYSFTWDNGAVTQNINNLQAGTYVVTVRDSNACTISDTALVTQPAQLALIDTVVNDSCFGLTDGSIHLGITGGITPYTFAWSNGPITRNISNLSPGAYTVIVTDSNGCTITKTENITQPQVLGLSAVVTNVNCFGDSTGSIILTVTGGTPFYSFNWGGGIGSQNRNNIRTGNYTVTVTDNYLCSATLTETLTSPPAIFFNAPVAQNVTCFGGNNGNITITASGGSGAFGYAWSNGSNTGTASNLSAFIPYTVTATDAKSCTADTTMLLNSPTKDSIALTITNVRCFGDSNGNITAKPSDGTPGYSYVWSTGATSNGINGIKAGNYFLTITDNATCTASASATITQPSALSGSTTVVNVLCFGNSTGSVNLYPTGGTPPYTYMWNNTKATKNIANLIAGIYTVTISDSLLCTAAITANVTEPLAPLALSVVLTNEKCFGDSNGAITLTVTGGTTPYGYNWGGGITTQNRNFIPTGLYAITVTDNAGCTDSISATITSPSKIHFSQPVLTNVTCFGGNNGSMFITATGGVVGFAYLWSNGSASDSASNLFANKPYSVTATDTNSCQADTSLSLNQPLQLLLSMRETPVSCFGFTNGTASVIATGGTGNYTYLWSNNQTTGSITALQTGGYIVTVTDANGCTVKGGVAISQPGLLTVHIDSSAGPNCTYSTDGLIDASGNGGTLPYDFKLTENSAPVADNSTGQFMNLSQGNYTILLTDSNGCSISTSVTLNLPLPDAFNITTSPTSCYGPQYNDGAIHIATTSLANGPYLFSIDGGNQQYDNDFFNVGAGTHQVVIYNYRNCVTDTMAIVVQPAEGLAAISPTDTTLQLGQSIQLLSQFVGFPDSAINSWFWTPSMGLSCADCPAPVASPYQHLNDYTLTITYNKICTATASAKVTVKGNEPVYIPNAFTPNNDGNNDLFLVYGVGIKTVNLKIFNRWGEKIFESENQFLGWDGFYKNKLQEPGVYVYEADITFLDDTKSLRTGSVTLIR